MLWFALGLLVVLVLLGTALMFWARSAAATPEELARQQALATDFLTRHHDVIEATRRPLVRIALLPVDTDDPLASKVGGTAWWPAGEPLPRDARGRPLALLAQVNLAELPGSGLDLPDRGLLQFLVATDNSYGIDYGRDHSPAALAARRGQRVVYWPDIDGPAQALPMATRHELPFDPTRPMRMHFTAGTETMGIYDSRFEALFPGGMETALRPPDGSEGLDDEALTEILGERDTTPGHKLGGYPHFTQDEPRGRTDLELLFQLDSDDGVMWGDAGVGNFFITDEHLARRDFSRVFYTWDCC